MSEITNEAVIKVTADASGVEAGLRQVEAATAKTGRGLEGLNATAQKTGKSLENLDSSAGLRNMGNGAGGAAGQVDRATKSMADSIQRATASMSAGAKGSAAYYEALANSRGLNITALRPYLNQLDAVTRKTEQAAAAQRQLDAGNSFLVGLRSQADGIGKTAAQLAALRAEELGVADAARPLIEQLEAAEQAAGGAGGSVQGFAAALATVGVGGAVAAVSQLSDQYGAYVGQLRLATSGQSEFRNALALVRQIATGAQSDLSATGSLFSSITKSTRDLGIAQAQVANITEVVSLGLKVSGASSQSAASAIVQLTQAFNTGVLRGEEFNSVNEAAPRLMQALADGIGVPVGALRGLAEQGQLTTAVLVDALPRALNGLRTEAQSVETIGGAVTVLKNNILEMVGATAQSSGVVSILSGSIQVLSDNLVLAGGAMGTLAAAKLGSMLGAAAQSAYATAAANRALAVSNLAAANSTVATTAASSAAAAARVTELRAAVLAAQGNAALAITMNGLIPAQAAATAASAAHTAALTAQAAAARSASVAVTAARGALALLGGPVGAVVTVLGLAATAWAVWGNAAEDANDKAATSTEETTAEMIVRLDEQIKKLRERNELASSEPRIKALDGISEVDKDGLARAKAALDANRGAQGVASARDRMMLQLEEVELSGKYEAALARVKSLQGEVATAAVRTRNQRLDEWYGKNGSAAQRLAAELEDLRKQFGTIPPEMEKLVRAKFVDSAAKKDIADQGKAAKEYADLVDRISGKSTGLDADFYDNLSKLYAGYASGKQSLEEYVATVEDYTQQQQFAKQADEERKKALEEYQKLIDPAEKGASKALADARTQREENEQIGLGAKALAELNATRLESLALRAEEKVWAAEGLDITGAMADGYRKEAAALRDRAEAIRVGAAKQVSADTSRKALDELNQFLDPSRAQNFGEALREAFGTAGDSLSRLTASLDGYGRRQEEIAKHRATAERQRGTAGFDEIKYLTTVSELNERDTKNRLSGYGAMAGAAAGFFGEQSKGYKTLQAVSQVFHAAELAMTLAELVPKGISAVLNQGTGDPYTAFGRMAAMAAIVAGLGVAIGGIGSGGESASASRQRTQGTGTVLGSDNKSESIANSLSILESFASKDLNVSTGMLSSLRNIEAGIGQFASLLVRTTGVSGDFGSDKTGGVSSTNRLGVQSFDLVMAGGLLTTLDKLFGGVIGTVTNSIFGGKKSVEDTGFTMGRTNFANILAGGVNASQYADIKKDGGWFSSDKRSTELAGIGAEGNRQIGTILTSLYDTVHEAGVLLGAEGDSFAAYLNGFVVDIGKVSLKGKTGEEIQKELSAVFSKVGDELASFAVGSITQFQQVGEGALETLARVATNYAGLDAVLASVGDSFGATGVASIAAREELLALVGGLDELAGLASSFAENYLTEAERLAPVRKYVTEQLASMGLAQLQSRESFKQYVLGLDLTSAAQRSQYAALMGLQEAFAKLYPEIKDTTISIAAARSMLVDAYNAENDAISSTIDRMSSFASSLKSLRDNALLGGLSPLSPQQKYVEAKAQYEAVLKAARAGDETAQSNYQGAFNAFLTASRAVFASSGQYQRDFDYAQAATDEAARWAASQVDVGKAQLELLKKQVSGLIDIDKSVMSVHDAILQLRALDPSLPTPVAMAPPVMEIAWANYGNSDTTALVAEIRSLRQEVSSLRTEQNRQTGEMIQAQARSGRDSAEIIADATTSAVKAVTNVEQRVQFA